MSALKKKKSFDSVVVSIVSFLSVFFFGFMQSNIYRERVGRLGSKRERERERGQLIKIFDSAFSVLPTRSSSRWPTRCSSQEQLETRLSSRSFLVSSHTFSVHTHRHTDTRLDRSPRLITGNYNEEMRIGRKTLGNLVSRMLIER